MMPLISVIIPIYNTGDYLCECIDSILAQTFTDYEIILVDDGSTDNSGRICDEYASKNSCVSVIHKENGGIVSARKAGMQRASGKYISYIDSDDTIDEDMYENMINKAVEYDADAVICNLIMEEPRRKALQKNVAKAGFYDKDRLCREFYPRMIFGRREPIFGINPSLCNKIFKRSIMRNIVMNLDERVSFGEDALCSFPCLLESERIYVLDEAYYHYRMVETSVTHTYRSEQMYTFAHLIELLDKEFEKRNFDGEWQLNYYAAKMVTDFLRKELLLDKELSVKERIRFVKEYLRHPRIEKALKEVSGEWFGRADAAKIKLIRKDRIFALYILFEVRRALLVLLRKPYG